MFSICDTYYRELSGNSYYLVIRHAHVMKEGNCMFDMYRRNSRRKQNEISK